MKLLLSYALTLAVAFAASGCSRPAQDAPAVRESHGRVIVLGVDGLDFRLLTKLVAAGQLPNFGRLYREGSVGPIKTDVVGLPPLSPRIWSTYATGRLPRDNGLKDFVYKDKSGTRRLYSSLQRKTPAAWEIASAEGKRVGVVNWWFTYPAEKVNGFVVSDRYLENWTRAEAGFYGGKVERDTEKLVYPPGLAAKLAKRITDVKMKVLTAAQAEAVDRTMLKMAYTGLESHPVDLLMIYTRALDVLSHMRWGSHAPLPGEKPQRDEIVAYLRRYDVMLGGLLKRMHPGDSLMVLSDHGFERNRSKKGILGLQGAHRSRATADAATLILYGPRIQAGKRLHGVTALDILPTILELLGVPPSERMPGEVVQSAFLPDRSKLLARADHYERSVGGVSNRPATTEADQATIERLRMLGYMDEDK